MNESSGVSWGTNRLAKKFIQIFSITSYRKTQTKLLVNPMPYTEVVGIYAHTMSLFYKALSAFSGPWVPNILVILPGLTTGEREMQPNMTLAALGSFSKCSPSCGGAPTPHLESLR